MKKIKHKHEHKKPAYYAMNEEGRLFISSNNKYVSVYLKKVDLQRAIKNGRSDFKETKGIKIYEIDLTVDGKDKNGNKK